MRMIRNNGINFDVIPSVVHCKKWTDRKKLFTLKDTKHLLFFSRFTPAFNSEGVKRVDFLKHWKRMGNVAVGFSQILHGEKSV